MQMSTFAYKRPPLLLMPQPLNPLPRHIVLNPDSEKNWDFVLKIPQTCLNKFVIFFLKLNLASLAQIRVWIEIMSGHCGHRQTHQQALKFPQPYSKSFLPAFLCAFSTSRCIPLLQFTVGGGTEFPKMTFHDIQSSTKENIRM